MEEQSQAVGFKEIGANTGLKLPRGIWKHWPQVDRHEAGPLCFQGAPRACGAGNMTSQAHGPLEVWLRTHFLAGERVSYLVLEGPDFSEDCQHA